jgi:hypothetical protein
LAQKTRAELRTRFETGDIPTQQDFGDLIDSYYNITEETLVAGPQGPQGFQGLPGATGAQGNNGAQGPQGDAGSSGSSGESGSSGSSGEQGAQGLQGLQGNLGLTGLQGSIGPQGLQGDPGNQGPQGNNGSSGTSGVSGSSGSTGTSGSSGISGTAGTSGSTPEGYAKCYEVTLDFNGGVVTGVSAATDPGGNSLIGASGWTFSTNSTTLIINHPLSKRIINPESHGVNGSNILTRAFSGTTTSNHSCFQTGSQVSFYSLTAFNTGCAGVGSTLLYITFQVKN